MDTLVEVFPIADYPEKPDPDKPGLHLPESSVIAVPKDADTVSVMARREDLQEVPDRLVKMGVWLSLDGGKSQIFMGACTFSGEKPTALYPGHDGNTSGIVISGLPPEKGQARELTVEFFAIKPVRTKVEATFTNQGLPPPAPADHHSIGYSGISTSAQGALVQSLSTPSVTSTSGSLLVVTSSFFLNGGTQAVLDSKSNTYTERFVVANSENLSRTHLYENNNETRGSSHTFTVTSTVNDYIGMAVGETTGQDTSAAYDTGANAGSVGGVLTLATGNTATLSQAAEIAWMTFGDSSSQTGNIDAPSGLTQLVRLNGAAAQGIYLAYKVLAATTAISANYTQPGAGSGRVAGGLATYKEAGGGGGITGPLIGFGHLGGGGPLLGGRLVH